MTKVAEWVRAASTEVLEQRIQERPVRPVRIGNALIREAHKELQRRKDSV